MKRNLGRILNPNRPKMPKTSSEIAEAFKNEAIYNEYGQNERKTEPFYIETVDKSPSYSFTLFASMQVVKMIQQFLPDNRKYLMDGTFDVTPLGSYAQLLIIYVEFKNDVSFQCYNYKIHIYVITQISMIC